MDYVLMDIKNFLKKLESGQLEIEAGQWELHKDITNVKKTLEDLKELKEDLEKMRLSSVQQLGLIKSLQEKIDQFKQDRQNSGPTTVSESTVDYEKIYRSSPEEQENSKGHKKRKCHPSRSEDIEIASETSGDSSQDLKADEIENKESEKSGNTTAVEDSSALCIKRSQVIPPHPKPKIHSSRTPNNEILQRYLKDSVKYKENKSSEETETPGRKENKNAQETGNTPFWDEYRAPANSKPKDSFSKSGKTSESVTPKRLACPQCPRKFTYKADYIKHEREHQRAKAKFVCQICGKGFCRKDRLKMHNLVHKASIKSSKGYTCSYCNKECATPDKLTAHLRECRTIKRSRFRRKKL